MLYVAFPELTARTAQQVLAQEVRLGVNERHQVLQLIAEAKGAARLVVAAARPQATRQDLVHQPAVGQDVESRVGGFHLHRTQRVRPMSPHRFEAGARGGRAPAAMHQGTGVIRTTPAGNAEPEDDFTLLPGGQFKIHLDRGTGIQGRSDLAG